VIAALFHFAQLVPAQAELAMTTIAALHANPTKSSPEPPEIEK